MVNTLNAVPRLDALASALSQAWARLSQRQFEPLARWKLMHVDRDGELQSVIVDVLEAVPLERLILVRRSPEDEPLVIKTSRVVEAVDVQTGQKVMLDRWLVDAGLAQCPEDVRPDSWIH
ncbi:hypothetical protein EIP75_14350 [Aquabacterium soli]|uniref:Uncharacterized protein n=1 Tax=Aquabacterium soli TaxID=2493092 RepID=A0A426V9W9_9BURK|nr:hypothetical protein [Aquabacterium soli]RRS03759.1 hypothetical protein EIP75_14350 [Aquabacterium soli]